MLQSKITEFSNAVPNSLALKKMATETSENYSTYSEINCDGKIFTKEEFFSINSNGSGMRLFADTRRIDNLFHSVTKQLDKDFTSVKIEVETNINENQMEDFEKEWKSGWHPIYGNLVAEAPERSVIEVSMVDFELWLKLFPPSVTLKKRQKMAQPKIR